MWPRIRLAYTMCTRHQKKCRLSTRQFAVCNMIVHFVTVSKEISNQQFELRFYSNIATPDQCSHPDGYTY